MRVSVTTRKLGEKTRTVAHITDGKGLSASVVVDGEDRAEALTLLAMLLTRALNAVGKTEHTEQEAP